MSYLKEQWTESQLLALPLGDEHDYIERKAGALLSDQHDFRVKMAKALSAFANSGGGHIVLGQKNDGTFDGIPKRTRSPSTQEWLEQVLPNLVQFPLALFRVHTVTPDEVSSTIPTDREVLVIDIGDSLLAPHQAAFPTDSPQYYHRQGGKSVAAPHHYLELIRNRIIAPVLEPTLVGIDVHKTFMMDNNYEAVLCLTADFQIRNTSRVASHEWALLHAFSSEYKCLVGPDEIAQIRRSDGIPINRTILPTLSYPTARYVGIRFQLGVPIERQLRTIFPSIQVGMQAISEAHVGNEKRGALTDVMDVEEFIRMARTKLDANNISYSWGD
ncbi:MAG TPA: ATP-binding protein [Pirellulaceae bacterium]|nr:ATP-binding protein [Pirellulaceae bacterium]